MCAEPICTGSELVGGGGGGGGSGGREGCMHAQNQSADTNSRCFQLRSLCGEDIAAAPLKAP